MIRRSLLLFAFVACSARLPAQATPLVPPDAPAYRLIERLAAVGLIDTLIVGVRPFSEREVVRLLSEAQRNLGRRPDVQEWADLAIRNDLARYRRDGNRPIDAIATELTVMSSPYRIAPSDHSGSVDGVINPLAAYRAGRTLADGTTSALESEHSLTLGTHVAATISPRIAFTRPRGGASSFDATVQSGSATFLFGDFAVQAGRDQVIFGQAPTGGLLLSTNAPPLDMIRMWNDRPWQIPLLSRLFHGIRGSLFVADLGGPHQMHPHSSLIGYHLAGLPHPQFEIGVQVVDAMGGNGGQPASFGDRVLDAIPIIDALRTKSDFQFSNKLAGIDFRWRMPRWSGFELYGEGNADDFDGRNLTRGFKEDAGYLVGAAFSCLAWCGRFGVRAEYHQTGIRYYTHTDYPMASRGFLLGDPLGPRGLGGYLTVDANAGRSGRFWVNAAFEARSGNTYGAESTGPNDVGFHFILLTRRPSEKRARLTGAWEGPEMRHVSVQVAAGAERVQDFAFVAGDGRTNWLARVAVVGRP